MRVHYFIPRVLQAAIWIPSRVGMKLFAGLKIHGKENLKGIEAPVIFASNHQSEMDVIMIPTTLTPFSRFFPMFYVARNKGKYQVSTFKQRLYGGKFFHIWGAYPIISGFKDYATSLQLHIRILKRGKSLHIFPEGKLSPDGNIQDEAHGGVSFLSWKTNTPIVPVAIKGTRKSSPKAFFTRKKHYSVTFGKPIYPNEMHITSNPSFEAHKKAARSILEEIKKLHG